MPIVTIRTAIGAGEEASQGVRRPPLPAGQRAEAIQKILDALGRHLSGKEALSKEALVRLIEDLALILKFPPLPQESGRAFVRRLIGFLESMPVPERVLLERQLAGRSLAQRVAVLTAMPVGRNGASPPDQTPIRNLPLPAAVLQSAAAAQAPPRDVALLQALLKRTYSVDDGTRIEETSDGTTQAAEKTPRTEPGRATRASESPAQSSASTEDVERAGVTAGTLQDNVAEVKASSPEGAEATQHSVAAATPQETPVSEKIGSEAAASESTEPAAGETETATAEGSAAETAGDFDSDGTYGPPRADVDDGPRRMAPARTGTGDPPRSLAEAAKTIVRDSVGLPAVREGNQPGAPESADATRSIPASAETNAPVRPRDGARLVRNPAGGAEPFPAPASTEEPDKPISDTSAHRPQPRLASEDAASPQAIARLVESGLPREAIPFALVPYPPAQAASESEADGADRRRQAGGEGDAGTDQEDGEGEPEEEKRTQPSSDEDVADEAPDAVDAYGLYRKLGDLG